MFDRYAICAAYLSLENDWNVGGWLRQRPSNQRRLESTDVQLHRMGYRDGGRDGHSWDTLQSDDERAIYVGAMVKFDMAYMLTVNDVTHTGIIEFIRRTHDRGQLAEHFPQLTAA